MPEQLAKCLSEAVHYLKAAVKARREQDDVGMSDALGHIHDALRRARGLPRGDGFPESYPSVAPGAFRAGAEKERELVLAAIDDQLKSYTGEMALALASFRTTIAGNFHRQERSDPANSALAEAIDNFLRHG